MKGMLKMLDICLLGTGGMLPLPDRYLTAMLARFNGRKLLIDCGEGTQVTMKMLGWGYKTLDTICFTHYHGDHVTGLPGLLLTIGNSGRTQPVTLIGPPGLKKVVEGLTIVCKDISFELILMELSNEEQTLKVGDFDITILPVSHNVPCFAYSIENKRNPKFIVEKAQQNKVPQKHWKQLQQGNTVVDSEKTYTPDMVLGDARKGIKVTYFTDCRPTQDLVRLAKDSDLVICEAMYLEEEYLQQVKKYKHMLGTEGAQIAQGANAKELWLTHFSPALPTSHINMEPVRKIFANSLAGYDRMVKTFQFEED
jgi:ribonuclease Z